jgi:PAS domain S-box-containing protein
MNTSSTGSDGRPLPLGLRLRLAIAFGVLAGVLAGALSLVIGHYASETARVQIGRYLTRLAIEYRDKIDASLSERMDEVAMLARLDSALPDAATPERRRARLAQLMRNRDYAWIGYAGPAGRVEVASGGLLEGIDVSAQHWHRQARTSAALIDVHGSAQLAQLLPPAPQPRRFVTVAAPLGAGRGAVAADLDFDWVQRLREDIETYADPASPFELLLLRRDGSVLVGPPALLGQTVPLPASARTGGLARVERWQDGADYLVGASASRGLGPGLDLGWVSVARKRGDLAFAPVADLRRSILWAGLALALAGILAGWLLAARLARPLELLASAAVAVAAGKTRAALPRLQDYGEATRLSESMRSMLARLLAQAESLHDAREHTERRVRERTAELLKLQAQLELEVADAQVARDDAAAAHVSLALALEASELATFDYDVDQDRIVLGPQWSRMLGGAEVETRASSGELLELVPVDDRARVREALASVLAGNASDYRVEHGVKRPDGRLLWILSHGRAVGRDPSGRVRRILGTNRDITERVARSAALQSAERALRIAFDASDAGMALLGPDGRIALANSALGNMLGCTASELTGVDYGTLGEPGGADAETALLKEALAGTRSGYRIERRLRRKDGATLPALIEATLVRDELDLPVQFVVRVQAGAAGPGREPNESQQEKRT